MYFLYSTLYTLGFLLLLPRFVFDAIFKGKYAAGFTQRLGSLPPFDAKGRKVIWIHCVSVGETNAARPLVNHLKSTFPNVSLVISTTTATGQKVAREAFSGDADLVFYFPFDWKWTVRRSLRRIRPAAVLLMETEIWFNFIREASRSKARVAIVNGRLSERSYKRFSWAYKFVRRVLAHVDFALMQENADATRLMSLGLRASRIKVTGNLKYDPSGEPGSQPLTAELGRRFAITPDHPLILASSTHKPEESLLLDIFRKLSTSGTYAAPKLMIAPRHPERFAEVAELIDKSGLKWARRSADPTEADSDASVILLDSIGELRSAYPLAEIVFVGGSLIPHGGQSIFEPAAAGRAIVTGPYTSNFDAAVKKFLEKHALVQLKQASDAAMAEELTSVVEKMLADPQAVRDLGENARKVMDENRGAVDRTVEQIGILLGLRPSS